MKEEARLKLEEKRKAKEPHPVLQEINFKLLKKLDDDFDIHSARKETNLDLKSQKSQNSLEKSLSGRTKSANTKSAVDLSRKMTKMPSGNSGSLIFMSPSQLDKLKT